MKKLWLILLSVLSINAATITSTSSGGNYHTGSTWIGGVVPTDGVDTAVSATTSTNKVTIESNASPLGITCSGTGYFEVAQGVTLSPGSTVNIPASGSVNGCFVFDQGSNFTTSTSYGIQSAATQALQFFTANGSCPGATYQNVISGTHTISTLIDAATGVSPFGADGHIIASSDCFPVNITTGFISGDNYGYGGCHVSSWTNFYSASGGILPAGNSGCTLTLTNDYIDSSVGDFSSQYNMTGAVTFANVLLRNSGGLAFATPSNASFTNVAVTNAAFGYNATHGTQGSLANTSISRFVSLYNWDYPVANGTTSTTPDQILMVTTMPTNSSAYNYINHPISNCIDIIGPQVPNVHLHNPHMVQGASSVTGCILESMSNLNGSGTRADGFTMTTGYTYSATYNLVNAEPDGIAATQLLDTATVFNANQLTSDHNTMIGCGPNTGIVIENDSASSQANVVVSAANNLAYCASTGTTNFLVNGGIVTSTVTQNQIPPTTPNHNGRFNMTATYSICSLCTNQANSYIGNFSATPSGTGDLTTDPLLTKEASIGQASTPFFSSVYLGVSCPHWSSGTYSQWACVSDSNASYYGGGTINWRCVAASGTGCGTNEPGQSYLGSGTAAPAAYTYWVPDSFYQVYMGVYAGNTITDPTINCVQCSYIQADINWVRSQFAPLDYAHRFGGAGGTTMGAVTTSGCVVRMGSISSAGCAGPF